VFVHRLLYRTVVLVCECVVVCVCTGPEVFREGMKLAATLM